MSISTTVQFRVPVVADNYFFLTIAKTNVDVFPSYKLVSNRPSSPQIFYILNVMMSELIAQPLARLCEAQTRQKKTKKKTSAYLFSKW